MNQAPTCEYHGTMVAEDEFGLAWYCAVCPARWPAIHPDAGVLPVARPPLKIQVMKRDATLETLTLRGQRQARRSGSAAGADARALYLLY